MAFDILAAIDLRDGRVVRLRSGDFERESVYGDDPVQVGESFAAAGAPWLHVVDLDAARSGEAEHAQVIRRLLGSMKGLLDVEVAGGIRSEESARELLTAGASRVVLGTAALEDPELVAQIVGEHGSTAVAVAIDVRDGRAYGRAWGVDGAGPGVDEAIGTLAVVGVRTFEVTAIDRDGTLEGPDLDLLAHAVGLAPGDIIASGGIASLADLRSVMDLGCRGAIVGRAIYEGRIDLREAIARAAG